MSEAHLSKLISPQLVQGMQIANYNGVAATALLTYEVVITANQELTHIWRSRWSLVKVLYILARYPPLTYLFLNAFVTTSPSLTQPFCSKYILVASWTRWSLVPVVDALIAIRIHAIYERRNKMRVFLFLFWLATTACTIALNTFVLKGFTASPNSGIFTGCLSEGSPTSGLIYSIWGVASGYQVICVIITLYRLVGFVREFGVCLTPMVRMFFRDGVIYFLIILSLGSLNIILHLKDSLLDLEEASLMWGVSIASIAACRMVLNLRDLASPSSLTVMVASIDNTGINMEVIHARRRRTGMGSVMIT